jgi:hypothetical protein
MCTFTGRRGKIILFICDGVGIMTFHSPKKGFAKRKPKPWREAVPSKLLAEVFERNTLFLVKEYP